MEEGIVRFSLNSLVPLVHSSFIMLTVSQNGQSGDQWACDLRSMADVLVTEQRFRVEQQLNFDLQESVM